MCIYFKPELITFLKSTQIFTCMSEKHNYLQYTCTVHATCMHEAMEIMSCIACIMSTCCLVVIGTM